MDSHYYYFQLWTCSEVKSGFSNLLGAAEDDVCDEHDLPDFLHVPGNAEQEHSGGGGGVVEVEDGLADENAQVMIEVDDTVKDE